MPSPAFSENIPSMAVSRNPGELGTVADAFLYHHSLGNQRDFIKEKGSLSVNDGIYNFW
jgi:hypothetical protein